MAGNGDDADERGEDTGGFVFGEERATDESDTLLGDGLSLTVAAALLLVVAVVAVVVLAAVVQPLGGGSKDTAPGESAGTTPMPGTVEVRTETVRSGGLTDSVMTARQPSVSSPPTATTPPTQPPSARPPTATQTTTTTATSRTTPATTETATATERTTVGGETESATATSGERSPTIEAFTITDRSSSGTATFDVAWTVTDPDSDLVALEVSLVAGPDDEARVVERRRFDAGGAQTAGSTTF
ncbi:MAG TPA: hypothetical protein VFJ06_01180, partial [Halococcus sp.]|nr:hypothetical protein [Halococcus sp.]